MAQALVLGSKYMLLIIPAGCVRPAAGPLSTHTENKWTCHFRCRARAGRRVHLLRSSPPPPSLDDKINARSSPAARGTRMCPDGRSCVLVSHATCVLCIGCRFVDLSSPFFVRPGRGCRQLESVPESLATGSSGARPHARAWAQKISLANGPPTNGPLLTTKLTY